MNPEPHGQSVALVVVGENGERRHGWALRAGDVTEQAIQNMRALAAAVHEQEIANIMAITGCDRERAEKLHVWLYDDELVDRLHRIERAGRSFGERLAEAFRPLAASASRYRS